MAVKKIEDLPHFAISSVERGEKRHPSADYLEFKLYGTFDHLTGVREDRSWLLLPQQYCLIGDLESLDPDARTAVFVTFEKSLPDLVNRRLPYVYGYWQAYHVWMVAEPSWGWERALLQRGGVTAEVFDAENAETIQGQEVKRWIRVKEKGARHGKERAYPVLSGDLQQQVDAAVAGGWDHEHCELCGATISVGDHGFVDADEHWVCEPCYAKYVAPHDLSFLDREVALRETR
jgi:hypothetical protein